MSSVECLGVMSFRMFKCDMSVKGMSVLDMSVCGMFVYWVSKWSGDVCVQDLSVFDVYVQDGCMPDV